jgi:hypothetical protein
VRLGGLGESTADGRKAMAKRRRLINPAAAHRRMVREREFRKLRFHIELFHAMFESLVRSGDMRMIRRMLECRAIAHHLLEEMLPDIPQLIESGALEVKDISGEARQNANFAITHRGKVIKDGFLTQAAARFYIQRHLIAPAQLMLEHDAREEWPSVPQPSRAVH